VEVHIWTVNETAEMLELLALGVDGIITNYPPRLLEVTRSV
jgi:glycerophosphoryl diester phosphodiesterase